MMERITNVGIRMWKGFTKVRKRSGQGFECWRCEGFRQFDGDGYQR